MLKTVSYNLWLPVSSQMYKKTKIIKKFVSTLTGPCLNLSSLALSFIFIIFDFLFLIEKPVNPNKNQTKASIKHNESKKDNNKKVQKINTLAHNQWG